MKFPTLAASLFPFVAVVSSSSFSTSSTIVASDHDVDHLRLAKMKERHAASSEAVARAVEDLKTKDLGTRIQAFEGAVSGLEAAWQEVETMQPTGLMNVDVALNATKTHIKQFLQVTPEVLLYMTESLEELEAKKDKRRVLNEQLTSLKSKSSGSDPDPHPHLSAHQRRHLSSIHRKGSNHFEGNSHGTHHHDRVRKLQDAIVKGDHHHINSLLGSKQFAKGQRFGRRLGQQEDKAKQCQQLVKCSKGMSFYDTMIFFYSDDMDPTTGDIDESIYHFDEKDLEGKFELISTKSQELYNSARDQAGDEDPEAVHYESLLSDCDDLLSLFHRNVEFDGVPHWEGGTVSQVCLAEGSQTFIKLDEIATKLGSLYARKISDDMFQCAQDIYSTGMSAQPFPLSIAKDMDRRKTFRALGKGRKGLDAKVVPGEHGIPYTVPPQSSDPYLFAPSKMIQNVNRPWHCEIDTAIAGDSTDPNKCGVEQTITLEFDGSLKRIDRLVLVVPSGDPFAMPGSYMVQAKKKNEWDWRTVFVGMPNIVAQPRDVQTLSPEDGSTITQRVEDHILWLDPMPTPPDSIRIILKAHLGTGQERHLAALEGDGEPTQESSAEAPVREPDRSFSIFNINFILTEFQNGPDVLISPSGYNWDNRDESGQIKDVANRVFTSSGSVRDDIAFWAEYLRVVYRYMHKHTTETTRGDVMIFPKQYENWELNSPGNQWKFKYYAADEAVRFLTFVVDSSFPVGRGNGIVLHNKKGVLKKPLRDLQAQIEQGLEDGYGDDGTEGSWDDSYDSIAEWLLETKAKPYIQLFQKEQLGYDLVFGEKTSIGFLCGVKEAVVKHGPNKWPGYCCLSAPFQNKGDNWGRKHDCNKKCTNPGPFFAGLSEESCSVNGGTWCPTEESDCSTLKRCIDTAITENVGKEAFIKYLEPGSVGVATDAEDCASSREYFGYDALYTNDQDICDNVLQLQNTRDFAFLDDFYTLGNNGGSDTVGWETLDEPNREHSGSSAVRTAEAWETADFYMTQAWKPVKVVVDTLIATQCPKSPVAGSWCASIINALYPIFKTLLELAWMAYEISVFTRQSLCSPTSSELIEASENTAVLYDNLKATNSNIKKSHDSLLEQFTDSDGNLVTTSDLRSLIESQCGTSTSSSSGGGGRALLAEDGVLAAEFVALQKQNEAMDMELKAVRNQLDDQQKEFQEMKEMLKQLLTFQMESSSQSQK